MGKYLWLCSILFLFSLVDANAAEYKIMAWNVEDMDIFDGQGTARVPLQIKKEAAIASVIRKADPDVMLIVEAPSLIEMQYFVAANHLGYQVAHFRQQRGNRSYADGFVLMVKKGLSLKKASLETPPVEGGNAAPKNRYRDWSMRGLVVAEIEDFTFIGVHLKSPTGNPDKDDLVKQLKQAKSLIEYTKNLHGPVIVAGDFNDEPGRGPLEKRFDQPDTIGILEKTFKRAAGDERTHEGGFNIDHIMVKNATASRRSVVPTPWSLSDHRPIWAMAGSNRPIASCRTHGSSKARYGSRHRMVRGG